MLAGISVCASTRPSKLNEKASFLPIATPEDDPCWLCQLREKERNDIHLRVAYLDLFLLRASMGALFLYCICTLLLMLWRQYANGLLVLIGIGLFFSTLHFRAKVKEEL